MLGDIDPLVVERILETGATAAEIDEALRVSLDDSVIEDRPHPPSSPRVVEVRALLDDLVLDVDDEDEGA